MEVRDSLIGYARYRFDSAAFITQRNLFDFAQNLKNDDLHIRMPDMVKTSGWNRRLKNHGKAKQRLMIGAEAAERDANRREKLANQEALRVLPFPVEDEAEDRVEDEVEDEVKEEEEPAAIKDPFLPPPSTAPARLPAPARPAPATLSATSIPPVQYSRAGRKRAPTAKALEAENPAKRGAGPVGPTGQS
jgi:hypothetical protein